MKVRAILFIIMAYANYQLQAMNPSIDVITSICKHKYDVEYSYKDQNFFDALDQQLKIILKSAAASTTQLVNHYKEMIFLLPKELPSLTISFYGNTVHDSPAIIWNHNLEYIKRTMQSYEEQIKLKNFKQSLKKIIVTTKAKLHDITHTYIALFSKSTSIKLKIQIHFDEKEEEMNCLSISPLAILINHCSQLYDAYRW